MKVTKKETQCFKPYQIVIEVQTEQEQKCLKCLFGATVRIPAFLKRENVITESSDFHLLTEIMESIHQSLPND